MNPIFLTGYSNSERHSAIENIKAMVARHGDIVDFALFSDLSITMTLEIPESEIDSLYRDLQGTIGMDSFPPMNSISKMERKVYLNFTFSKGSGDLVVEVPSVPG